LGLTEPAETFERAALLVKPKSSAFLLQKKTFLLTFFSKMRKNNIESFHVDVEKIASLRFDQQSV
jgi:hypothetical protein